MKEVDSLMNQGVADGVFPGAVLLISAKNEVRFFQSYGVSNLFTGKKMTIDTVFDLASLTKPLATTLAIIYLIQNSKLDFDTS
ncbi:MAG: serine hydrolase domain-containing protein, partial [Pseudomonadota bacterium]